MPHVRTPLITKNQDVKGDGSAQLGVITALLTSAGLLLIAGLALASEGHLPHAIQGIISSLSSCSARLGLNLSHLAVVELLVGSGGFVATTAVGLVLQNFYSKSSNKHSSQARHGVSNRVGGLIKALGSAEERERLRDTEQDTFTIASYSEEGRSVIVPPAEKVAANSWRVHGMYEHQILKAGLQHLDAAWPSEELLVFASEKGSNGSCAILRKKLLTDLINGEIHLRSVPAVDLAAAQGDLRRLSLAQLLRLRVLHIDFVPSGSGSDSVSNVGSGHQTFINLMDKLLFEQLGRKAAAGASNKFVVPATKLEATEAHRLGREAVLIVAAASSVPSSPWWSWWMTADSCAFLHVKDFVTSKEFPSKLGVLEVKADRSRPDPNEPTGKLRWFDWNIELATSKAELSQTPPQKQDGRGGHSSSKGAAAMPISVETLSETRRGLRQMGSTPRGVPHC